MNENESAAPFSFIGARSDSPGPELFSEKELMCLLPIVVELAEKAAAPFFAQFVSLTCISNTLLNQAADAA